MRLFSEIGEDGVITVSAKLVDGRTAPVADFWVQPMIDGIGASRDAAKGYQEQFAALLVSAHNRLFECQNCYGFGYVQHMKKGPQGDWIKGRKVKCPDCENDSC